MRPSRANVLMEKTINGVRMVRAPGSIPGHLCDVCMGPVCTGLRARTAALIFLLDLEGGVQSWAVVSGRVGLFSKTRAHDAFRE